MSSEKAEESQSENSNSGQTQPKLEGEPLRQALQKQIEFYFSRQNLSQDPYLVSQMNAQKFVPVDIICNFKMIKALSEDREVILEVMRNSKELFVDPSGSMVRPNLKMERTTLILRDIPKNTDEEEVKAIFKFDGCGKILSVRADIQDTWFVTFETEEDCLKTAMQIGQQKFRDKPIKYRVKSENLLRSFYTMADPNDPTSTPTNPNTTGSGSGSPSSPSSPPHLPWNAQQIVQPQNMVPPGYYTAMPIGFFPMPHAPFYGYPGEHMPFTGPPILPVRPPVPIPGAPNQKFPITAILPNPHANQNNSQRKGRRQYVTQPLQPNNSVQYQETMNNQRSSGAGKGKKKKVGQFQAKQTTGVVPLSLEHFPELPSSKKSVSLGYQKPYTKYSRLELAEIVAQVSIDEDLKREITLTLGENSHVALRSKPLTESQLLKPFPLMFPASPSPMLAARPPIRTDIPDLQLDSQKPKKSQTQPHHIGKKDKKSPEIQPQKQWQVSSNSKKAHKAPANELKFQYRERGGLKNSRKHAYKPEGMEELSISASEEQTAPSDIASESPTAAQRMSYADIARRSAAGRAAKPESVEAAVAAVSMAVTAATKEAVARSQRHNQEP